MSWTSPGDLTMRQRLIKVDQGWWFVSDVALTWFKQDHTGINLNLCKSVYLYVCLCIYLSVYLYIYLSIYNIYIYLSIYLSNDLSNLFLSKYVQLVNNGWWCW
jgi:hypothetical protein